MTKHVIAPGAYLFGEKLGSESYRSGDEVTVRSGVTWFSDEATLRGVGTGSKGLLSDLDVEVYGAVKSGYTALDLGSDAEEVRESDITVGTPGAVLGLINGVVLSGGGDSTITNRGVILGTKAGIRAGGDGLAIKNDGLIGTYGDTYTQASRYHAISITHGDARIDNGGAIVGREMGLAPDDEAAIRAAEGARLDIRNASEGLIAADHGMAILGGDAGDAVTNAGLIVGDVDLRGGTNVLRNEGWIGYDGEYGRFESGVAFGSGDDLLENAGTVFGTVATGSGDDVIRNTGHLDGMVELGDGDDVFENVGGSTSGVFLGEGDDRYEDLGASNRWGFVSGGAGNDTYVIASAGSIEIYEYWGEGYDTVRTMGDFDAPDFVERIVALDAGGREVRLRGNAEDNRIQGGDGSDKLRGFSGDDRISGGDGRDTLIGDGGDDRLMGGSGADRIAGDAGSDVLRGGSGDDRLAGGKGGDLLAGGRGADVFEWRSVEDAGEGRGGRDVVTDFRTGRDALDLTGLDLTFRDGAFSGTEAEIRVLESGSRSILRIDGDGDGDGDMTIVLRGVHGSRRGRPPPLSPRGRSSRRPPSSRPIRKEVRGAVT